jgi:hypothetical protein
MMYHNGSLRRGELVNVRKADAMLPTQRPSDLEMAVICRANIAVTATRQTHTS